MAGRCIADTLRFIPARAGNTLHAMQEVSCHSVYPRSRGEHDRRVRAGRNQRGLSPLARGTPNTVIKLQTTDRFIPARAGNMIQNIHVNPVVSVYPRSRGEHYFFDGQSERSDGLSPLARGTPAPSMELKYRYRFIPARAGNTR